MKRSWPVCSNVSKGEGDTRFATHTGWGAERRDSGWEGDLRLCWTEPLFIIVALHRLMGSEGGQLARRKEGGGRQACGLIGKFERPRSRLKDGVAKQQPSDHTSTYPYHIMYALFGLYSTHDWLIRHTGCLLKLLLISKRIQKHKIEYASKRVK